MMNKKVKNGSIIGLVLTFIISVFANFYSPLDCSINDDVGVFNLNVNKNKFQPLFVHKKYGISYMIFGKPDYDHKNDTLNHITLKVNKLSGLLNVKIDRAKLKGTTIEIKLSHGISNKGHDVQMNIPIKKNKIKNFNISIFHRVPLIGKYNKETFNLPCKENGEVSPETIEGRICNFDCMHE